MSNIAANVSSSVGSLMEKFDIITHNMANVNTAGYKCRYAAFEESVESGKYGNGTGQSGQVDLTTAFDFSQGGIPETGRSLDFALHGKGFFVVETTDGPVYTRNGSFQLNQNGQIVNCDGNVVLGDGGPITIPADAGTSQIHVSNDGNISAAGTSVGKFQLVDFGDDESKLESVGTSNFMMPDETVTAGIAENVVVKQGYQESSNVKMIEELVGMIAVTRLYEANMKSLKANGDAMDSLMNLAMG